MIRIFLLGYMGAGKTTLGKAFARAMGIINKLQLSIFWRVLWIIVLDKDIVV